MSSTLFPHDLSSGALDHYTKQVAAKAIKKRYLQENGVTVLIDGFKRKDTLYYFPLELMWLACNKIKEARIIDTTEEADLGVVRKFFHAIVMNLSCFEDKKEKFEGKVQQVVDAYYFAVKPLALGVDQVQLQEVKKTCEAMLEGLKIMKTAAEAHVTALSSLFNSDPAIVDLKKQIEDVKIHVQQWDKLIAELGAYEKLQKEKDSQNVLEKMVNFLGSNSSEAEKKKQQVFGLARQFFSEAQLNSSTEAKALTNRAKGCRAPLKTERDRLRRDLKRKETAHQSEVTQAKEKVEKITVDILKLEKKIQEIGEELKKPLPIPLRLDQFLNGLQ